MSIVRDIPVPKAVQMVREKIEGVMEGGPDGLRRAFRVFDSNMNGSIDFDEFDQTLKRKLNLRFEHGLLRQVMAAFDDTGDGTLSLLPSRQPFVTMAILRHRRDQLQKILRARDGEHEEHRLLPCYWRQPRLQLRHDDPAKAARVLQALPRHVPRHDRRQRHRLAREPAVGALELRH